MSPPRVTQAVTDAIAGVAAAVGAAVTGPAAASPWDAET